MFVDLSGWTDDLVAACFILVFFFALVARAEAAPRPGEIYREYAQHMGGNIDWRVTDPNARTSGAAEFLPNPVLHLNIGDLKDAVKAEALIDRWGGHTRTSEKQIRFNDNDWILVPELQTTPAGHHPSKYYSQDNPVVEIPLSHLHEGDNTFEGTCGTIENYGWGQWGLYSVILRIYYDPDRKSHPVGRVVSPTDGQEIGEDPEVDAEVSGDSGIARVDFLAYYEGYDEDGDGVYQEWHGNYHQPQRGEPAGIRRHVGSVTEAPYRVIWKTRWVPDQEPGSVKILARVQDKNGIWYVTEPVEGLSLVRPNISVKLYKAYDVPKAFGVRMGFTRACKMSISGRNDLARAVEASLYLRTWHGTEKAHSPLKLNGWSSPLRGKNHHYDDNIHEVPVSVLRKGDNVMEIHSDFTHHMLEILWPGPSLVVRYSTDD